jgi:tellurite resistance protein
LNPGPSGEDTDIYRLTSRCRITEVSRLRRWDRPTSGLKVLSKLPDKADLKLLWRVFWRTNGRGDLMAKRYTNSGFTTPKLVAEYSDYRDEEVMEALVTAGGLVALADGRVETVERDELLNFIDRQQLVPSISQHDIAHAFENRLRQLEDRDSVQAIVDALRPLAGLSLASVVIRAAERVAAADRKIHPGELQAIKLIRLIMTTLTAMRPAVPSRIL